MNAVTLIQAITFISYVTFLMITFKGPLPSISDSYYRLQNGWKYLFLLFCTILGFSMFFQAKTDVGLFFLSGAALCFVGVASRFKEMSDKSIGRVHYMGALVGIVSALLAIGVDRHDWGPMIVWVIFAGICYLFKIRNSTWWIEIAAFVCIISGLIN